MASKVLAIQHKDVSVHLFVETLIESGTEWFGQLQAELVTSWVTLV